VTLVTLCKELQVDPDRARLWAVSANPVLLEDPLQQQQTTKPQNWILDLRSNIVDQRKRRNQEKSPLGLMLEIKDLDTGKWPRGADGTDWSSHSGGPSDKGTVGNLGDGIVGLYNME